MAGLDFLQNVEVRNVESEMGYDDFGMQLKQLLPKSGDTLSFVFGLGNSDSAYNGNDEYTAADMFKLCSVEWWDNTANLTPAAATARGKTEDTDFGFTTNFFASTSKDAGVPWWKDLGYSFDVADEMASLSDGLITPESYIVARGGRWFDKTTVLPQVWAHLPVTIVEIVGKGSNRTITPVSTYWLKLRGSARGQYSDFVKALGKAAERENPSVYLSIVQVEREDNFYNFSLAEYPVPDEDTAFYESEFDRVTAFQAQRFTDIHTTRHGSNAVNHEDPETFAKSQQAVKDYFVATHDVKDWDEFCAKNSIFASPVDLSGYTTVAAVDVEGEGVEIPF